MGSDFSFSNPMRRILVMSPRHLSCWAPLLLTDLARAHHAPSMHVESSKPFLSHTHMPVGSNANVFVVLKKLLVLLLRQTSETIW